MFLINYKIIGYNWLTDAFHYNIKLGNLSIVLSHKRLIKEIIIFPVAFQNLNVRKCTLKKKNCP